MRVYDPDREREVIQRVRAENRGPLDDEGLQHLFERIIDECRRIERKESEK
jgi:chorismate mutase/prephenate dehydratase